ncbi:hypothetical protein [Halomarina litorea]|uniref:hypothetical protein n=1 Tax=Halomarina litorea TaxID=2961595 RepID=UPI0020C2F082|nr:hypothetical protein [Halomarina sp. BCD28]
MGLADDIDDILSDGAPTGDEGVVDGRRVRCTACGAERTTTDPPAEVVCDDCGATACEPAE